jgi:hypothetical protein
MCSCLNPNSFYTSKVMFYAWVQSLKSFQISKILPIQSLESFYIYTYKVLSYDWIQVPILSYA